MRHCFSEAVSVYETEGPNLSTLLRDAATTVDDNDDIGSWFNVHVSSEDGQYRLTLYVH